MKARLPVILGIGFLILSACGGEAAVSSSTTAATSTTSAPATTTTALATTTTAPATTTTAEATPASTVPEVDESPGGADNGVIVCYPLDRYDEPQWRELVVVGPEGDLVRSIALELGGFGPTALFTVAGAPWVMVEDRGGAGIDFVDVSTGEVRSYPDYWASQGLLGEGRWVRVILASAFSDPALVDFLRGRVVDLGDLLGDEGRRVSRVTGGSSDTHVVAVAPTQSWLIPMDDPTGARALGPVRAVDLSADGRLLFVDPDRRAFSGSVEDDGFELVSSDVSNVWFVGDSIMLVRDGSLVLIDSGGSELPLWQSTEDLKLEWRPAVAPGGRYAVIPLSSSEGINWVHVDVVGGEATALGTIPRPISHVNVGRYVVLYSEGRWEGFPTEVGVIDIVTGDVSSVDLREPLSFRVSAWSASEEMLVLDGYSLIYVFHPATGTTGSSASVGYDPSVSPDGTQFVWEEWDDETYSFGSVISPIDDPTTTHPLGVDCADPVWVSYP